MRKSILIVLGRPGSLFLARMFGDIREFVSLWNLSGPDCYAQNDLHQVVRYSVADGKSLSLGAFEKTQRSF